jgi:hypothetical protein
MTFLCMDTNFRLKNQLVSNYSQDPGLGVGWVYMVPQEPYEAYMLSKANDADVSIQVLVVVILEQVGANYYILDQCLCQLPGLGSG